jgi:hypothetical protein
VGQLRHSELTGLYRAGPRFINRGHGAVRGNSSTAAARKKNFRAQFPAVAARFDRDRAAPRPRHCAVDSPTTHPLHKKSIWLYIRKPIRTLLFVLNSDWSRLPHDSDPMTQTKKNLENLKKLKKTQKNLRNSKKLKKLEKL